RLSRHGPLSVMVLSPSWPGVSRPPTHWRLYSLRGGPTDRGRVAGTRPAMTERAGHDGARIRLKPAPPEGSEVESVGITQGDARLDQRSVVQECHHLLSFRRRIYGRERRRHRRLSGPDAAAGLPPWSRCHGDLADAVPALADAGRRL